MAEGYKPGLWLDRKDNNGNYTKENCQWVTPKEQQRNRRDNRLITIGNKTKTFAEWAETSTVKPSTIRQRFYVYGWSIEDALYTPARGRIVS